MKKSNKEPKEEWIELKEMNGSSNLYATNLNDNQLLYGD